MPDINIKLEEPSPVEQLDKETKERKYYPSLHITTKEKLDLPEDGEMTIKYHKSQSSMMDDERGKRYSCTIEAHEIVSAYPDESNESPTKTNRESEDALDKLMEEAKEKSKSKENSSHKEY